MPTLPSFLGRKKYAIPKPPFSIRRAEPSILPPAQQTGPAPAQANPPPLPDYADEEVIDINSQGRVYSMDFNGGRPNDEYEQAILDNPRLPKADTTISPQVKLDIELSPGAFTDWLPDFMIGAQKPENEGLVASGSGEQTEEEPVNGIQRGLNSRNGRIDTVPELQDGRDDDDSSTDSAEEILTNLQAMDPSHFGKMPGYEDFNRLEQSHTPPKKSPRKPNAIAGGSNHQLITSEYMPALPSSTAEELVSSAVSGSTLARALMSNSYILPSENRSSRFFRGGAGLERADSGTLGSYHNHKFSRPPDQPPPIPSNAEALYQPPKTPRDGPNGSSETLTRQRNGSISKSLPKTPSVTSTRPTSSLLTPGVEFNLNYSSEPSTPLPETRNIPNTPRSPLPLPPTPKLPYLASEDGHSSRRSSRHESVPEEYRTVVQQFPLDSHLISPDLNMLSPALSSEGPQSAKDLDGVLTYYENPDTPGVPPVSGYQPAFSPISEESASQLSPPLPITKTSERRESMRNSLFAGSIARVRHDPLTLPRRPPERNVARTLSLLAVPENASSQASSPTNAPNGLPPIAPDRNHLAPPAVSTIFNRPRNGSAPSPIVVERDLRDVNVYNITVSPGLLGDTPTEEDSGVAQEFPETPNMFSPLITGNSVTMMSVQVPVTDTPSSPVLPRSATLPPRGGSQNLAQTLLLGRAGTTVGHVRHPSGGRIKPRQARSRSPSTSTSTSRLVDISTIDAAMANVLVEEGDGRPEGRDKIAVQAVSEEPAPMHGNEEEDAMQSSRGSSARFSNTLSLAPSALSQESDTSSSMYSPSPSDTSSNRRQRTLPPLPPMPRSTPPPVPSNATSPAPSQASLPPQTQSPQIPLPPLPVDTIIPPVPAPAQAAIIPPAPEPHVATATPAQESTIQPTTVPTIPPPPAGPPPSPTPSQKARAAPRARMPPALTLTNINSSSDHTVAVNGPDTGSVSADSVPPSQNSASNIPRTTLRNPNALPNNGPQSLTYKTGFVGERDSDFFRGSSPGSPPPYYQVIDEPITQNDHTPTTNYNNSVFTFPVASSSQAANDMANGPSTSVPTASASDWTSSTPLAEQSQRMPAPPAPGLVRDNSLLGLRSRMRPPLPAGPRRPSQVNFAGFPTHQLRDRSGSVSSVGSGHMLHAIRERDRADTGPQPSPRFETPAPKWRGYTMEAAKWTFTSAQLQAIVSRAIRQSAEASSIRLLRLEILDNDLPEEVRRLEAQRTELVNRYKSWARRRTALIDGLGMYLSSGDEETAAYALRMVDDLREVSAMLDGFTEELHSVDGQLAHLDSLVQIHSGSALAMALRKLNTSFLKQVADNQTLRTQVQTLEAERDEAWRHAEDVANEMDKMESQASSRRSSRISAVRKSSIRVSRAGLRTPNQRLSQVSSHGSAMHPFALSPRPSRIPPVPPIPRQRRLEFSPDPLSRTSMASGGYSPTSETEALIEVQDELYAMLGIKAPERPPPRRSRSISIMSGGSSAAPSSAHHTFIHSMRAPDTPGLTRRSSLPGNSTLVEAYNVMSADRNAVLATIDMLSSTD